MTGLFRVNRIAVQQCGKADQQGNCGFEFANSRCALTRVLDRHDVLGAQDSYVHFRFTEIIGYMKEIALFSKHVMKT